MKRIPILIISLIIIGFIFSIFYREGSLAIDKHDTTTKIFIIHPGERVADIAKNLEGQGLIRSKIIFYITVKRLGIDNNIQAGDFRLSPSMNTSEIAKNLTKGTLDEWVTVVEGLRKEEVAEIMAQKFQVPEVEFINLAKEGYLFPDTYLMPSQASSEAIIAIMKKNFYQKYDQSLQAKAAQKGLTELQVLTLASLVEREATANDVQGIANVIYKRYKNDYPLQVDASVQYALGYQTQEKTWWKKALTLDDLKINSPYNTYVNTSLPPGPISSPGIDAIKAVVNADENTPYMFYLHDKNGGVHYARTGEEHQKNIDKYL